MTIETTLQAIPWVYILLQIIEVLYFGNIDDSFFSREMNFFINLFLLGALILYGYKYSKIGLRRPNTK